MQSFLLLSPDEKVTQRYVADVLAKEKISQFDLMQITQEEEATKKKTAKKSLGIESIKNIQRDIYLTPVQGQKKLLVIHDANLLTLEAQNALLKLLEEPPLHLILILVTDNIHALLPTIHSRCFLINLVSKEEIASPLSSEEKELLQTLSPKTIYEWAEKKGKTKEDTMEWSRELIGKMQHDLHTNTSNETIQQYSNLLRKLLKIHQTVSNTNISPRMTIECILLSNS